jgi:hypothetical protein
MTMVMVLVGMVLSAPPPPTAATITIIDVPQ